MRRRVAAPLVLALAVALAAAACGDDEQTAASSAVTGEPTLEGRLTVSAASSLTEAFERIATDFEAANPGVDVTLNVDSSTTLAQQIADGAPADAFASADEVTMDGLVDGGETDGEPVVIATNSLVVVVEPGNPQGVRTLADLADLDVVSICGETVPCGRFAQQALDAAGVTIPTERITRGQNARATLSAVSEGDADAAIVYVTDAASAGASVETVTIPAEQNVVATYPMAVVAGSGAASLARAFVAYVAGPEGQAVLRDVGFGPP